MSVSLRALFLNFFVFTLLFFLGSPFSAFAVSDPLWEIGTKALEAKDSAKAAESFQTWIEAHQKIGIQSPEAHYNLGLAYWDLKQTGPAVYQILQSATLQQSPLRVTQDIQTLISLQNEIGIKEGIVNQWPFELWLIVNPDINLVLFSIGFWALVGFHLWRWYLRTDPSEFAAWSLILVSGDCLTAAALAGVNRHYFSHLGVLLGDNAIALYQAPTREPSSESDAKLAELPSGTIVSVGKIQNGFIEITQPVMGWVLTTNLKAITPSTN